MTLNDLEMAVVRAALDIKRQLRLDPVSPPSLARLLEVTDALIFACPDCNRGGHTCPGDGNSIEHGDYSCGEHDDRPPVSDAQKRLAPYLAEYATNVAEEWMRIVEIDEDAIEPGSDAMQLRARWFEDHSFKLGTHPEDDDFGYYRVTIHVQPFTLPPLGPENDPALAYEQEESEWAEANWLRVLEGDRVRLPGGTTEAQVTRVIKNLFHAQTETWTGKDGRERDNTVGPWDHYEVRVGLAGITEDGETLEFPASGAVLIWADAERRAVLALQEVDPLAVCM